MKINTREALQRENSTKILQIIRNSRRNLSPWPRGPLRWSPLPVMPAQTQNRPDFRPGGLLTRTCVRGSHLETGLAFQPCYFTTSPPGAEWAVDQACSKAAQSRCGSLALHFSTFSPLTVTMV